jgi:hypothetical protein
VHAGEYQNLYSSPSIVRMINSWIMRWAGHVERLEEEKLIYVIGGKYRRKETTRKTKTSVGG